MCSFIFTSVALPETGFNRIMRLRGPDLTNTVTVSGYHLAHNLLSMRGDFVAQPHLDEDEDVAILFNGELYNCPETEASEAKWLMGLYRTHGSDCFTQIDGEYAIVIADFARKKVIAARDCFGTKPLFFAAKGKDFGFASYRDALETLDLGAARALPPNRVVEYALDGRSIITREIYQFDIAQYDDDIDGWCKCFEAAVAKRVRHLRGTPFVGLSSGYDSGAIAAALIALQAPFQSITVEGREDPEVIRSRLAVVEASGNRAITLAEDEIDVGHWRAWLTDHVENQPYLIVNDAGHIIEEGKSIHSDNAALMLAAVCYRARQEGSLVYLSGSGADEIYSDYGFRGQKFFAHSNFGGLYPENLLGHFPWASFFGSTQAAYLSKEEMVAGSFGMEARYPFLDVALVQKFLSLRADFKNEVYKSVVSHYLDQSNFPVLMGQKVGFGFKKLKKRWRPKKIFGF